MAAGSMNARGLDQGPDRTTTVVLVVASIWAVALIALIVLLTKQGPVGLITFALGLLPIALVVIVVRSMIKH